MTVRSPAHSIEICRPTTAKPTTMHNATAGTSQTGSSVFDRGSRHLRRMFIDHSPHVICSLVA